MEAVSNSELNMNPMEVQTQIQIQIQTQIQIQIQIQTQIQIKKFLGRGACEQSDSPSLLYDCCLQQ